MTGVPGTASVTGTLNAIGLGGVYTVGTRYTVLNATGGVSGTFSSFTVSGSFGTTKPHLEYDASNVYLVLDPNALSPFLAGATPNQRAVAGAVDAAIAGGSQAAPFLALFNLAVAQFHGALDQLSGEVHASNAGVLLDESLYPRSAVLGRLRQASYGGNTQMASLVDGRAAGLRGRRGDERARLRQVADRHQGAADGVAPGHDVVFWAQGFGASRPLRHRRQRRQRSARSRGLLLRRRHARRHERPRSASLAGYTASRNALDGRGTPMSRPATCSGYGGWSFGSFNLRAGGAFAWHTIDTGRTIAFPGFFDSLDRALRRPHRADLRRGRLRLCVRQCRGRAVRGRRVGQPADRRRNERGGPAALALAANTFEVGYSTLGLRAASMIPIGARHDPGAARVGRMAARVRRRDAGRAARVHCRAVPFVVAGAPIARDCCSREAGLDLAIGRNATLGVSYVGQLARNVQDHAAKGKFSWKF